uniref:Uncharacterized protein n=1 Tax=Rousettus aegyptiacus TaxID=9407 RepID=A0A7J8DI55_ROUAE|nr:hypothetical protein HJG63_008529 [Rousettus aegyptiacus]
MAEGVARSLNVTSCYVCRGTLVGDRWPWEATELVLNQAMPDITAPLTSNDGQWILEHTVIGQYCLARGGENLKHSVGNLICSGQRYYNATSIQSVLLGNREEKNPFAKFPRLAEAWHNPGRA